jgi:WD40 repeat protein
MADTKTAILALEIPIPDFEIIRRIGQGAFGEVFLAVSKATGRYRAVKVVRRSRFESERPYEIEFAGVKRFEEVSREHVGFVDILHVSRDDQAGHFSYVMELADDLEGQQVDPETYVPRTLSKELDRRGRLPPQECARMALALIEALAELHRRDLVHRDIKPGNIVFVRGAPKLADVGLVTETQTEPHTLIGSPDYMDAEVHGTPAGDLYSFGKVLYTMSTGLPPRQWPELPEDFDKIPELPVFRELGAIWRRACRGDRQNRYQNAGEIHKELLALQAGASVLRLKRFERTLRLVRRYGLMLLVLLLSLGVGFYFHARQRIQAQELRQRKVGSSVSDGNHALANGDLFGALSRFAEAWRLDSPNKDDFNHRLRLGSVLQHTPSLVQMWFQDREIKEAFFAGQENQIVISDSSGQWRVYDLASGLPLHKPFGMGLPHEKVSLSSRTTTALTSAETNRICLWDYQTGNKLLQLERPATLMNAALSADGKLIAAAERKGGTQKYDNVLLWKTPNQPPILLGQHPQGTLCLIFSPDSRLLLSAGYDSQARIWDVEAGRLVTTFTNHRSWVYTGTFSPDSRYAVSASFDRSARIWDPQTALELARFSHDDAVYAAEYNSDSTRFVTAGLDFTARIWNPANRKSLQVLRHNSKVIRAAFSPQDRFLLTACFDDTVRIWHLRKPPTATPINGTLTLRGARTILRTNGVWSLLDTSGARMGALGMTNDSGVAFQFAPDDRYFVVVSPEESVARPALRAQCFDAQTAAPRGRSISVPLALSNLVVSSGGQRIFAFNREAGSVGDTISGAWTTTLSNGCNTAAFSPDGKLLAVGRANQVEVFDLENNFTRLAVRSHPRNSAISAIQWDAASRRLITSCWDMTFTPLEAQTWFARNGKAAGPLLEHRDGILYATFSHTGTRAITCGEDFIAILWDPTTGRRMAPPLAHHDQVFYAAFSEDDRLVATVTRDNMITVWSAETGDPLTLPLASGDKPRFIRFTADNSALIIRNDLGQSYFWKLPRYERSLEDLLLMAQLLSAQQTDSTESLMPHSKEALRRLWEKLKSKYPADFTLPVE